MFENFPLFAGKLSSADKFSSFKEFPFFEKLLQFTGFDELRNFNFITNENLSNETVLRLEWPFPH